MGYQYLHPDMHPISRPDSLGRAPRERVVAELAGELTAAARVEDYGTERMALSVAARILRPNRPELADLLDACAGTILPGCNVLQSEVWAAESDIDQIIPTAESVVEEARRNLS